MINQATPRMPAYTTPGHARPRASTIQCALMLVAVLAYLLCGRRGLMWAQGALKVRVR